MNIPGELINTHKSSIDDTLTKALKFGLERTKSSDIEKRDYQIEAWLAIDKARGEGKKRALVQMATGLGKTTIAAVDARNYMQANPGSKGLFLAHQNAIIHQARERFVLIFDDDYSTAHISGVRAKIPKTDFIFSTLQTMKERMHLFDPNQFDYIVVDESHHGKANTFEKTIDYFEPNFLLGITATPDRNDLKEIREIFGQEIYSKSLSEALAEELLAKVDYRIVIDDNVSTFIKRNFSSADELNNALFMPKRNEEVVAIINRHAAELKNPKTIIFCKNIASASELVRYIPQAVLLTSELSYNEQKRVLDLYKSGRANTILTVNMFNEGVDIPDANLLVFMRTTQSSTIFQQQLGRGLRLAPGKDTVRVLDFVANSERLGMIKDLVFNVSASLESKRINGQIVPELNHIFNLENNNFDFDEVAQNIETILNKQKKVALNMSNAQIIELALKLSPQAPIRTPLIKKLSTLGQFPSTNTIKDRFGSMPAFHEACGFEQARLSPDLEDEELIKLALELCGGKRIREKDLEEWSLNGEFLSPYTISKRFGSLGAFNQVCGLQTFRKGMSRKEIVDLALQIKHDLPLSSAEIDKLSKEGRFPSTATINNRFGTIPNFHRACGFASRNIHTLSNESLVELALQLSPTKPLSQTIINELSKNGEFISCKTIRARFGSLGAFQQQCGFERTKPMANPKKTIDQLGGVAALSIIDTEADDAVEAIIPELVTIDQVDILNRPDAPNAPRISTVKIDYLEQNAVNHETGLRGEQIVMQAESQRLKDAGRPDLAEKIWQASLTDNSLGFDILSFESDGRKKHIEVKATSRPRNNRLDFFISDNELRASEYLENYYLYYVDDTNSSNPRITVLKCPLDNTKFSINPINYSVSGIRS
jgi:superfamily II DNA or RNA helicase